ncbi:hypothetical protein Scep_010484 [Stephania cephalantha]|uniref:Uncharacterized protein n=1 Tax=Stephania cephalantha TaxID=152367 RepID=A0AAP0JV51_9MAGN
MSVVVAYLAAESDATAQQWREERGEHMAVELGSRMSCGGGRRQRDRTRRAAAAEERGGEKEAAQRRPGTNGGGTGRAAAEKGPICDSSSACGAKVSQSRESRSTARKRRLVVARLVQRRRTSGGGGEARVVFAQRGSRLIGSKPFWVATRSTTDLVCVADCLSPIVTNLATGSTTALFRVGDLSQICHMRLQRENYGGEIDDRS